MDHKPNSVLLGVAALGAIATLGVVMALIFASLGTLPAEKQRGESNAQTASVHDASYGPRLIQLRHQFEASVYEIKTKCGQKTVNVFMDEFKPIRRSMGDDTNGASIAMRSLTDNLIKRC